MNKDNRKLGIDLGGSKIEVLLLDAEHRPIERQRCNTPQDDYQATLAAISALLQQVNKKHAIKDLALGICTPGSPSTRDGLMKNCNSTCLNGRPLKADLEKQLQRPVRLANDADCFALAETMSGAARGADCVFGVILGTGVGGGLVIKQQLLQGPSHIAGEWGHNPLALQALFHHTPSQAEAFTRYGSERLCYCGRRDCVETWLSGPALSHSDWQANHPSESRSAKAIAAAAAGGEQWAKHLIKDYTELLALALSNVINIIDPEVIVLGGGLSKIQSLYTDLPKALAPYVFSDEILCKIKAAEQGDSAGALWGRAFVAIGHKPSLKAVNVSLMYRFYSQAILKSASEFNRKPYSDPAQNDAPP